MPKTNGHAASPGNGSASKSRSRKNAAPTNEAIQLRAYQIYLERNGAPGDPLADWVRAETELLQAGAGAPKSRRVTAKSA
jgi:hypothetical protein